jgi:general secretion pathway protein M
VIGVKIDREQAISIAALALLLLGCLGAMDVSVRARSEAVQELTERREALSRLEAKLRTKGTSSTPVAAPPAAFLDAPTQGLAGAQLQAYLARVAGAQQASLISSGLDPAKREDPPDTIRLQATLDLSARSLQAMLYQLESGTPYVLVEALTVQPAGAATGRPIEDPLLRATLGLRAFWRRGAA